MRPITFVNAAAGTAALAAALSLAASASALSLGTIATNGAVKAAAGAPVATNVLLCGTLTPGTAQAAGASAIEKVSGTTASGNEYPYTTQNCDNNGASSIGTFAWTVMHSNLNTTTERGTEHALAMLSTDADKTAGFNGQITNYDFASTPDACGNRQVYYASGHAYDSNTCSPSGAGNFNTHGGAATGDHYRGQYGTVVYQNNNDSNCKVNSGSYCFEAILEGQTN